jgi:hypothetical protein
MYDVSSFVFSDTVTGVVFRVTLANNRDFYAEVLFMYCLGCRLDRGLFDIEKNEHLVSSSGGGVFE